MFKGSCRHTQASGGHEEGTVKVAHTDLKAGARRHIHSARGDDHFVTVGGAGGEERDGDVTRTRLVLAANGGYRHVDGRTKVRCARRRLKHQYRVMLVILKTNCSFFFVFFQCLLLCVCN